MARILLVEDNEPSRDALGRRLERRGFEVAHAVDGEDAVMQAHSGTPDLILMDLGLPGIDGWEATARLKMDQATTHIPIIVLSAFGMPNEHRQALAAGGDDFDSKPVQFERLLKKIENLLVRSSGLS